MLLILDDHRMLVEPSCGAALSCIYDGLLPRDQPDSAVVIIVCGGSGVSLQLLQYIEANARVDVVDFR